MRSLLVILVIGFVVLMAQSGVVGGMIAAFACWIAAIGLDLRKIHRWGKPEWLNFSGFVLCIFAATMFS